MIEMSKTVAVPGSANCIATVRPPTSSYSSTATWLVFTRTNTLPLAVMPAKVPFSSALKTPATPPVLPVGAITKPPVPWISEADPTVTVTSAKASLVGAATVQGEVAGEAVAVDAQHGADDLDAGAAPVEREGDAGRWAVAPKVVASSCGLPSVIRPVVPVAVEVIVPVALATMTTPSMCRKSWLPVRCAGPA